MTNILYLVNGIPGLEDLYDKKLLFRAISVRLHEDLLELVTTKEAIRTDRIEPGKNYAIEIEFEEGKSDFHYYSVRSFEVVQDEEDPIRAKILLRGRRVLSKRG